MSDHPIIPYPALPSAYTAQKDGQRRIDMLILHATAGHEAGDLLTLSGRDRAHLVSVHYYVTKAGTIYQLVPDKDIAWHAGVSAWEHDEDLNRYSLGIELENANDGVDPYPDAQIAAATWLARTKVQQYHIARSRVVTHAQVALPAGRKSDPRGMAWATFVDAVYAPAPAFPALYVPRATAWVREGPSMATPYARWHGGQWQGQIIKLSPPNAIEIIGVVTGQKVTRTGYGTSDQWLHLPEGYVWANHLRALT